MPSSEMFDASAPSAESPPSDAPVPGATEAAGVRTLVLTSKPQNKPSDEELRRLIAADLIPDTLSADAAIGATLLDDRYFNAVGGIGTRILNRLPFIVAQMVVFMLSAGRYDAVVTWGERHTVLVAGLLRLRWRRPAHVAILMWPSKRNATLLRLAFRVVDRFLVFAPLQRRYVQQELGVPGERFVDVRAPVDTRFWHPMGGDGDLICAVGQEMRDYPTFLEALRPLDTPCHIAVGTGLFDPGFDTRANGNEQIRFLQGSTAEGSAPVLPSNVTLGPKPRLELRELYSRARFVVVPLVPSDMDNGITVTTEALAMGKPVICTESPGQVGLLEDGVNCIRVPPFDADALREAIVALWNDPALCARLGAAGRQSVEERHSFDQYKTALVQAVVEAVATRRR